MSSTLQAALRTHPHRLGTTWEEIPIPELVRFSTNGTLLEPHMRLTQINPYTNWHHARGHSHARFGFGNDNGRGMFGMALPNILDRPIYAHFSGSLAMIWERNDNDKQIFLQPAWGNFTDWDDPPGTNRSNPTAGVVDDAGPKHAFLLPANAGLAQTLTKDQNVCLYQVAWEHTLILDSDMPYYAFGMIFQCANEAISKHMAITMQLHQFRNAEDPIYNPETT